MNIRKKRRSMRLSSNLRVRWIRLPKSRELVAASINEHGMFLRTDATTTLDSLMQLETTLPGGGVVTMFAVARFVGRTPGGAGIGVEIHLMDDKQRQAWLEFYRGAQRSATRVG
jgi:hypothetical protein